MPSIRMMNSVLSEYGFNWAVHRALYSVKLKTMNKTSFLENCYEKKTAYPSRYDLFQIDVQSLQHFLQNELDEEQKRQLITLADQACEGIIKGFSSIKLDYGNPIDWQLNPLTGKRIDQKVKWYKIPDFDKERGDIKVIWEASRFSHFITFARAYLLTDNNKYYEAFHKQLQEWLDQNPYSYGANFKCGQECSFRMVNALLTFTVFEKCNITKKEDSENIKELIYRSYKKILSNFNYAYKCIKNNHTISELMGMIIGAWCCQDEERLNKAYDLLDEVIDEQFSIDGGYKQFSFNYQRLALQDLECVLSLSKVIGKNLSKQNLKKINDAAILMFQCLDQSNDMPNYGSNDGALVFPMTACSYRDFRPIINTIYFLLNHKCLFDHDIHEEEILWWFNQNINEVEIAKMEQTSSPFADAGLFTLRNKESWAMLILNEYKSRPAHMDQLHIDLWINGVNVFCDSGTYSYASDLGRELIKNKSHNTACIEDAMQMNSHGAFLIYGWTKRVDYAHNNHEFYGKIESKKNYSHERRVEMTYEGYCIKDQIKTEQEKQIFLYFYTVCQIHKLLDNKFVLIYNGKKICTVEVDGKAEIIESYKSLYYLKKEKIMALKIKVQNNEYHQTLVKLRERND